MYSIYTLIFVSLSVSLSVYICMHIYMSIYMYTFIYLRSGEIIFLTIEYGVPYVGTVPNITNIHNISTSVQIVVIVFVTDRVYKTLQALWWRGWVRPRICIIPVPHGTGKGLHRPRQRLRHQHLPCRCRRPWCDWPGPPLGTSIPRGPTTPNRDLSSTHYLPIPPGAVLSHMIMLRSTGTH